MACWLSLLIATSLVVTIYATPSGTRQPRNDVCQFGSTQYVIGDSWHPYLRPNGIDYCILCSCHAAGQVRCDGKTCPYPTCAHPRQVPGQCCPTCASEFEATTVQPTTTPQSCQYKGREYEHGELFTATDIFRSRRDDQCVQCSCSAGRVYCALRTCPEIPCANSVVLPDSCCPVCQTTATEEDYDGEDLNGGNALDESIDLSPDEPSTEGSFPENTAKVHLDEDNIKASELDPSRYVCVSNGKTYYEDQSWHPVLVPFGRMDCILCTCKRGEAVCGRMRCPNEENLPCANPIQRRGACCKVCPDIQTPSTGSSDENPSEVEENDDTPLCLRKSEKILLHEFAPYLVEDTDDLSEYQFVVEDLDMRTFEKHSWEFRDGIILDFQIENLTEEEFLNKQETNRTGWYQLTGASTHHRLQKLKRKEQKLEKTCTSNCQRQVVRLIRMLRPRVVERGVECTQEPNTTPRQRGTVVPTRG
ncbi:chordin-like protein 1 [Acanthaster planci]|uniref:Chordin-like protein 1 n=1 Tax=Acanthaster planci TaxID=133434 RepID=A0A8B7YS96_ACAPL|nr:chordin-like protein 1 [Acanthaster planci]